MGGAALHLGNIAEMKTGEGKTLVATLPAYLNALDRRGRPRRHGQRLPGEVPRRVDGPHPPLPRPDHRRDPARRCAPTRGARPTPATSPTAPTTSSASTTCATTWPARIEDCVQRGHNFAIVDEVDSILIDEARTPLIITGPTQDEVKWYGEFAKLAAKLRPGRRLRGRREEAHHLGARARHHQGRGPPRHRQPLRVGEHPAHLVPATTRSRPRSCSATTRSTSSWTARCSSSTSTPAACCRPPLQRGPAPGDRGQGGRAGPRGVPDPRHHHPAELLPALREALRHDRYGDDRGLGVRQDLRPRRGPDPDQQADGPRGPARPRLPHRGGEVRRGRRRHRRAPREGPAGPGRHRLGREVRAPLRPAEASAASRTRCSTPRSTPTRRRSSRMAGHKGAVTVATNMAGRGTDIMLGGSVEFLADAGAAQAGPRPGRDTPTSTKPPGPRWSSGSRRRSRPSTTRSATLGGLYVIGTERHESRRIDNQLRGRSGRQGDPGESRFYLSLRGRADAAVQVRLGRLGADRC